MLVMPFTRLANRFNLWFARYSLVNRPLNARKKSGVPAS